MAATASTQKEGGPHAKGPFPPFAPEHFGSQLVWFAIAFGLLYLLLARFVLPRIAFDPRNAPRAGRFRSRGGGQAQGRERDCDRRLREIAGRRPRPRPGGGRRASAAGRGRSRPPPHRARSLARPASGRCRACDRGDPQHGDEGGARHRHRSRGRHRRAAAGYAASQTRARTRGRHRAALRRRACSISTKPNSGSRSPS